MAGSMVTKDLAKGGNANGETAKSNARNQEEDPACEKQQKSPKRSPCKYIDKIHMLDVLCGQGGQSNRHPGNQYYRHLVLNMNEKYQIMRCINAKKDLSMEIVQQIQESGGRFIKIDEGCGKFYVLALAEARKKTSQALREIRCPIWT